MYVERLEQLSRVLDAMRPGQRVALERASFHSLWPRPPYPRPDDYLSDEERARKWCRIFDCDIWEQYDPPALVIERQPPGWGRYMESIRPR